MVEGCALRIEGGSFTTAGMERRERCPVKAAVAEGQPDPCEGCPIKATRP
jgi:hypothetical protein